MLSVPFKKTDASIDFAGPLRRYLMKEFPESEATKYAEDLKELQHRRATVTQIARPAPGGHEALLRYAAQLEALEAVFPVSETEVRVGFKWSGAFNPNKKSTQSTLLFEKTCILYNLGAHESRSASEENRNTEAGIRAACNKFQASAGIFHYIRESVVGGLVGTLTQDLIPDGLSTASVLMLAQAQACFYEKAVNDRAKTKIKPALIAKLAAKASEYYTQALGFMEGPNLSPGLDKSWPAHVEFQSFSFSGAACYWQSFAYNDKAEETGSGYGIEVAQLRKASGIFRQAFHLAQKNNLSSTFTSSAESLNGKVSRTLALREKDNKNIYCDPEPGQATLIEVKGSSMVKALPFQGLNAGEGDGGEHTPLFQGLLSKSAKASVEEYKRREASTVGALDTSAKEQSASARSQLASVGLPGTVEAHESVEGIPESVWKKMQAVKQGGGGLQELKDKVTEVESSAERARNTMETVEKTLDQDIRIDDIFRKRYAGEFGGMSTEILAGDLRRDLDHFKGLWRTARSTDAKVMSRLEEPSSREGLELLELGRDGLDAAMPAGKGAGADDGGAQVQTAEISAKLVELAALLADRDAKLAELNDFVKNRNAASEISVAARNAGGGTEAYSSAVEHTLQGLQPFLDAVDSSIKRQGPLLQQIFSENERFQKARASDHVTVQREAFLQKVHHAVMLFHEVHAQLSEGATFYSDLSKRLSQLNQTCEDLVYTQGLQRREFEVGYTHRRERALKEGEDASIELARQMEAQAKVGQPQQQPQPPQQQQPGVLPGGAPPSAGYPSASSAYGQSSWSGFNNDLSNKPLPPRPSYPQQPAQQSAQQPAQQPAPYQPSPYQPSPYQPSPYQPRPAGGYSGHGYQQPRAPAPGQYDPRGHQPQYNPQGGAYPPGAASYSVPAQQGGGGAYYTEPTASQPSIPMGIAAPAPAAAPPAAAAPAGSAAGAPSVPPPRQGRWGRWTGAAGVVQGKPLPPTPTAVGGASGAGGAAPGANPNDAKMRRLTEMGFDAARARTALAESGGDENAAVSKLLTD